MNKKTSTGMTGNRESILHGVNPMTMIKDCKRYEVLLARAEYLRACADIIEKYALRYERVKSPFMRHKPGSWVSWGGDCDEISHGVVKKVIPRVDREKPGKVAFDYAVRTENDEIMFTDPPKSGRYGALDLRPGIET